MLCVRLCVIIGMIANIKSKKDRGDNYQLHNISLTYRRFSFG